MVTVKEQYQARKPPQGCIFGLFGVHILGLQVPKTKQNKTKIALPTFICKITGHWFIKRNYESQKLEQLDNKFTSQVQVNWTSRIDKDLICRVLSVSESPQARVVNVLQNFTSFALFCVLPRFVNCFL